MIRIIHEFVCDVCAGKDKNEYELVHGDKDKIPTPAIPIGRGQVQELYCRAIHYCPKHRAEVKVIPA